MSIALTYHLPAHRGSRAMSVRMELSKIFITENHDMHAIELREVDGARRFPIMIGLVEIAAIERRLKNIPLKRPQTHELLASVIEALGGRLDHILINDLRDHTFYATLFVEQGGRMVEIDSRPSDAIALGIATEVPIEVAEHVLEQAGQ